MHKAVGRFSFGTSERFNNKVLVSSHMRVDSPWQRIEHSLVDNVYNLANDIKGMNYTKLLILISK